MTVTGFSAKTLLDAEESTGSGVTLNGGDYSIECIAGTWNSATAQLQKLSDCDGTTWLDVTDISFTADGMLRAVIPYGTYRGEISGSPTDVTMVAVHARG